MIILLQYIFRVEIFLKRLKVLERVVVVYEIANCTGKYITLSTAPLHASFRCDKERPVTIGNDINHSLADSYDSIHSLGNLLYSADLGVEGVLQLIEGRLLTLKFELENGVLMTLVEFILAFFQCMNFFFLKTRHPSHMAQSRELFAVRRQNYVVVVSIFLSLSVVKTL